MASVALVLFAGQMSVLGLDFNPEMPPSRTELFATSGALRGFGALNAKGYLWEQAPGGERAAVEIRCDDAKQANLTASKYVADLLAYGAAKRVQLPRPNAVGVDVQNGGRWAIGVQGASVIIAQAANPDGLGDFLKFLHADRWSMPDGKYPRYLDDFDNESLSIWCYSNTKSPQAIDFMARNHLSVRIAAGSPEDTYAPGVSDAAGIRNVKALAKTLGSGYKFCAGAGRGLPNWFQLGSWPFIGDDLSLFAEPRDSYNYYCTHFESPEGSLVLQDAFLQTLRSMADDPNLLEWMEPHGERTLRIWRQPPGWKTNYPLFLKEKKGYSLAQVSARYTGSPETYRSWNDVAYPDLAEFYGRRGHFADLDSVKWRWRTDDVKKPAGIDANWWKPDFDDSSWANDFRWNPRTLGDQKALVKPEASSNYLWYRFADQGQAELLKAKKVWLHMMPFSGRNPFRPISIWINGAPVVQDFVDKAQRPAIYHLKFDVTPYLKATPNQYTILYQDSIHYRVWLSDQDDSGYPTQDECLNRKWVDWIGYLVDEQLTVLERYLRLIRSVDPVRPIKIMAPDKGMLPLVLDLCEKYGAFPHLTGENPRQFRPEDYKSFGLLRGLPSTSEPAGPVKTTQEIQALFANILWESQDNHDYGFDLDRTVMTQPEVVNWFDQNRPTLATLGKTSLGQPQVGVLFDAGQGTLYNQGGAYNWNLGRGLFSQAGFRYAFLSAHDLSRGLGKTLPVIIDSATQVMTPETVKAVQDYVAGGGTFVAMHLSGINTEEKTGSWPLLKAFGFAAKTSPGALPLTFTQEQDLFPELKGQALKQGGLSIDYLGDSGTGNVAVVPGDPVNVTPIAHWQDGSLAIVERRVGKGRFLFFGTPVYFRAKDVDGKWCSEQEQQALLKTMLHQLGIDPKVGSSDPAVWTDWRESKNGLYQVLFASRMISRDKPTPEKQEVASPSVDLWCLPKGITSANPIEVTAANAPSVAVGSEAGQCLLKGLTMEPKRVRQFAFIRRNVGLEGPMHWLKMQSEYWRAVEPVAPSVAQAVADQFEAKYPKAQAQDVSFGWKVHPGPVSDAAWMAPGFADDSWQSGSLGAWFEMGWQEQTSVCYRKEVPIPQEWQGQRIVLGFEPCDSTYDRGATPNGKGPNGEYLIGSSMDYKELIPTLPTMKLWVHGENVLSRDNYHAWALDVTDRVKAGRLGLAFEVTGSSLCRGPAGTMYLWAIPKPVAQLPLDDSWVKIADWWKNSSEKVTVGKADKSLGWSAKVTIPKDWKGGQVYLVVEEPVGLLKSPYPSSMYTVLVNGSSQFSGYLMAPIGLRLDNAIKPGVENTIELIFPKKGDLVPTATRLELYRGFGTVVP